MDQNLSNRRAPQGAVADTVARQQHPPPQACPRCNSTNTKFCYYNNYSLSQPRYFCKGCRRYWTHGGTLRNVPVGGGCRKSKRPKLSNPPPPPQDTTTTATATATATAAITNPPPFYGGGGGFLSSLAAVHNSGAAQPMGFGPNLGLFHGLGLPSFENQLQPHLSTTRTEHNQELSFQQLLQRDVGVGPTSEVASSSNWNLSNEDNNRHQTHWSDFPASTGLDDP